MEAYKGRVKTMVSFDGSLDHFVNYAVGSTRYKITIKTEGGHSFAKFGNKNAIAYMASLIDTLYKVKVPKGGKTTYNVGAIKGGTSVNTIAQEVEMIFEYRSDVREHLASMMDFFDSIITAYRKMDLDIKVDILGIRPCMGDVNKEEQAAFEKKLAEAIAVYNGKEPSFDSGSTDANIPFSQGVTACTVGVYMGGGAHTREEWVDISSLKVGYPFAMAIILDNFRKNNAGLFE
jgi:acetylornithine deacetylase/succinyl-diaminopimelate desuccinylase-like protein